MTFKVNLPKMDLGGLYQHSFKYYSKDSMRVKTPVDLTGQTLVMDIRKADGTLLLSLSSLNGMISIDGNVFTISVSGIETAKVSFTQAQYDLVMYPGSEKAKARVLMYGNITAGKIKTVF